MKLLLDTHAFLWLIGEPERLPSDTLAQLRDPATTILVSAVTAFEIATKNHIGKLAEAQRVILAFDDFLQRLGGEHVPVTAHHSLVAGQLRWDHRDPFDRILAAQSIVESVPLVTADPIFASIDGVSTIWD